MASHAAGQLEHRARLVMWSSSVVERGAVNADVAGSNPASAAKRLTEELDKPNALVLRHSFANPFWWQFHFFMHFEHKRRGRMV
jgi:hypothetical protein